MARSRNIKPGFFTNDELVELPFEVRLLFIGLWTIADKSGRLADRPKKIKMEIFPGDSVDCDAGLKSLSERKFLRRYEKNGERYIQILNWDKHQNPHIKEAASLIPPEHEQAQEIPVQDPEKEMLAPEIPEQATPITDSLLPITDSKTPKPPRSLTLPDWLDETAWNNFLKHRGKKFSEKAQELSIAKLDSMRRKGHDPTEIMNESIANGWKGLFEPKGNHGKPAKYNIGAEAVERLKRSGEMAGSPEHEVHEYVRGEVYEHDPGA